MTDSRSSSVHRWSLVTMIGLLALLAAGASVNSLGGALSVPDWPLSYGKLLPTQFVGQATHEQSHRALAAICLVVVLSLGVAIFRRENRQWVRAIGFAAVALYLVQVIIGGVVVLALDPPWLAALHVVLALATFVLSFVLVVATSAKFEEKRLEKDFRRGRALATSCLVLALLQVVLGATSRHPPAGSALFVAALLSHLAVAFGLLGLAVALVVALRHQGAPRHLRATATGFLIFVLVQIGLGLPLFVVAPEPGTDVFGAPRAFAYLHIAHVVVAALVLAHAAALVLRYRTVRNSEWGGHPAGGSVDSPR